MEFKNFEVYGFLMDLTDRKDIAERRSSDRVFDNSTLIVSGVSREGQPFQEITRVNDVSPGGISFLLSTLMEAGQTLQLGISPEPDTGVGGTPMFQIKVQVLRVDRQEKAKKLFLIAAQFQGEFANLNVDMGYDALVRELKQAVEYDESRRHQFE